MRKFIKNYLAKEYDNYVKDLEALTNIDSGNGDLEGTEAANKFVAAKMQALGAETEFRYNDRGCHLISRLKGKGTQTVLLVAHVDTVFKRGEAAKRPFRVDENGFAWGPGVGDDKATVMEVIYGLAALKEAGFDDYKEIIYYTNAEEEGGSPTAEGIVAELSQQADFAVIMDVARPNWGIVTQRKGNAKYKITVTGMNMRWCGFRAPRQRFAVLRQRHSPAGLHYYRAAQAGKPHARQTGRFYRQSTGSTRHCGQRPVHSAQHR